MSNIKCPRCGLLNWTAAEACKRCRGPLDHSTPLSESVEDEELTDPGGSILKRSLIVLGVVSLLLTITYLSLKSSSDPITADQQLLVDRAVDLIDQKGFGKEAFILRRLTVYRSTDNWLNEYAGHAEAYAATNFPFEIVTLYPDFFGVPVDDVERAVVLLHESRHLMGSGENVAFSSVWLDKRKLGWTKDKYGRTAMWKVVREFTAKNAPELFRCGPDGHTDCLEQD